MTAAVSARWGLGSGRKTVHLVDGWGDGHGWAACGRRVVARVESPEGGSWRECQECQGYLANMLAYSAEADPNEYDQTVMTAKISPSDGEGNTPRRTIRVPDAEWNAAKAAAEANGDNLSEIIRTALKRYTTRAQRAQDGK